MTSVSEIKVFRDLKCPSSRLWERGHNLYFKKRNSTPLIPTQIDSYIYFEKRMLIFLKLQNDYTLSLLF